MLARKAGLELGELGGVRCDARLETSAPGVFAAGDMCEYDSVLHGRVMRIEHEDHAERQGETAARSMLGAAGGHEVVPYFFSDLADWASLEYVGPALSWDEEIVRGSVEDGEFSVFYLDSGRVGGVLSVGRPEDIDEGRTLIASGEQVTRADLARA
jgi:3-phenylpropionate/trans-cinnamate dioxygenase ferredoxin reductase component